jgi:hypothetical protein
MTDTTSQSLSEAEIQAVWRDCYKENAPRWSLHVRFARAILAKQREMDAKAAPVAYCEPDNPMNSTAFAWPGSAREERHSAPLFSHPPAAQDRGPMTKVPAEIVRYAKAMKSDGYRGPLSWASAVIDWVAGLEWREASPSGKSVESIDVAMSKEPQR